MKRLLPLLAGMVLLVTACKAEINYGFEVNPDGTGSIIAEFGFDEEFLQLLEGQDPFAENDLTGLPGAQQETYERGEFTFYKVTVPIDSVEALRAQATNPESSPFGNAFELTVTDEKATFRADLSQEFVDETTGGGESGFEGTDLSLEDIFTINIQVKLPGKVTSHNADEIVDGFLQWRVPLDGSGLSMQAESDPRQSAGGGDGFPVWLIVLIVAAVAAAGFYFYNQNQRKVAVAAPSPPSDPSVGTEPPSPMPPHAGDQVTRDGEDPPS